MKKRHKKLWIALTSVCGVIAVVGSVGFSIAKMYKTQIDVALKVL